MRQGIPRGFTLIEVLVAIGIIGFGLLSLLTLLPVGLRSTRLAGDFTTAAFLGRQELAQIRARAQIRDFVDDDLDGTAEATDGNGRQDPGEAFESGYFLAEQNFTVPAPPIASTILPPPGTLQANTQRDNDGIGYFDLPYTLKKGAITQFRVIDPERVVPQTYTIQFVFADIITGILNPEDFIVIGRNAGGNVRVLEGNLNQPFPLPNDPFGPELNISFVLTDNTATAFDGVAGRDDDGDGAFGVACGADPNCDEADENVNGAFFTGETIALHLTTVENAWYAYWASRYDVGEDRELPEYGLTVDGILTDVDPGTVGVQTVEDTGIDLVPNFFDRNFDGVQDLGVGEVDGETGFVLNVVSDPHGDDGIRIDNDVDTVFDEDPVDGADNDKDGTIDEDPPESDLLTGRGTENNGRIDAFPEGETQRVTVTVVWREGGRDREARFSTIVSNPFL